MSTLSDRNDRSRSSLWRSGSGQGWIEAVFGIWLCVSPTVLGFAVPHLGIGAADLPAAGAVAATWNAWIVGGVVIVVAITAFARLHLRQEQVTLALAAWVFAAPWVLGFYPGWPAASWDHWMTGLVMFAISGWGLPPMRHPA